MPTEYKHFFNQLDNQQTTTTTTTTLLFFKPLKTKHLIKLLNADPHLKFLFLHNQPLTYPFQSQCTITFQAGTFLKISRGIIQLNNTKREHEKLSLVLQNWRNCAFDDKESRTLTFEYSVRTFTQEYISLSYSFL